MPEHFDIAICGAGPAGAAAALAAVRLGLKTALIERAHFPRHKVCGDCLNPAVWPVLRSLGVDAAIDRLPHAAIDKIRFRSSGGCELEIAIPPGIERAVTRESFDQALLETLTNQSPPGQLSVFSGHPLTAVQALNPGWSLSTPGITLTSRTLIAADGRNSSTCRLLGLVMQSKNDRVAIQTHAELADSQRGAVSLEILPRGYTGIAPVDDRRMNLCLVSDKAGLAATRAAAEARFDLPPGQAWHSIAPLERTALPPAPAEGVFLAGDAARVVEPFTGEGIFYALRSGQLAASAAQACVRGDPSAARSYQELHRQLYHRRLWINQLSRIAVTHRFIGDATLRLARYFPGVLRALTTKVLTSHGAPGAAGQ